MSLFNNTKDKDKRIQELESNISSLMEEKESLLKEMDSSKQIIHSIALIKQKHEDEKLSLVKKHENEYNQLKKELEIEKKSVARKVNQELSNLGVNNFVAEEISSESNMLSPSLVLQKFSSMKESKEKHEFFEKYKEVIDKASKISN